MDEATMKVFIPKGALKRYSKMIVFNGVFMYMVYLALFQDVAWAANLVIFLSWVFAVIMVLGSVGFDAAKKEMIKAHGLGAFDSTYRTLNVLFDVVVIGLLASHAWWFTAVAYTIHFIFGESITQKVRIAYNQQFLDMFRLGDTDGQSA